MANIYDGVFDQIERLDFQALVERREQRERQEKELRDIERVANEQRLDEQERQRLLSEQQAIHLAETKAQLDRLVAEAEARQQTLHAEIEQAAQQRDLARIEQSRQDIEASRFAAQFDADQKTALAETARAAAEQSRQDIAGSRFVGQYGLDPAHDQMRRQEIEAVISGINDPEMAAHLSMQQAEIRQDWVERQRENDEARRVQDTRDQHERDARSGDLQPVSRAQADKAEQEKLDRELKEITAEAQKTLAREEARSREALEQGRLGQAEHDAEVEAKKEAIRQEQERQERLAREEAERRRIRNYEYTRD